MISAFILDNIKVTEDSVILDNNLEIKVEHLKEIIAHVDGQIENNKIYAICGYSVQRTYSSKGCLLFIDNHKTHLTDLSIALRLILGNNTKSGMTFLMEDHGIDFLKIGTSLFLIKRSVKEIIFAEFKINDFFNLDMSKEINDPDDPFLFKDRHNQYITPDSAGHANSIKPFHREPKQKKGYYTLCCLCGKNIRMSLTRELYNELYMLLWKAVNN